MAAHLFESFVSAAQAHCQGLKVKPIDGACGNARGNVWTDIHKEGVRLRSASCAVRQNLPQISSETLLLLHTVLVEAVAAAQHAMTMFPIPSAEESEHIKPLRSIKVASGNPGHSGCTDPNRNP